MRYYHGTANINAYKIIKNQHFKNPSYNVDAILWEGTRQKIKVPGSLGYGIYTFIDNPNLALEFARKENEEPVVLEVSLKNINKTNLLDLTKKEHINQFQKFASYGKKAEKAQEIFNAFKDQHKIIGTSQDVYAGIMTELFIAFLKKEKFIVRYVKKHTETLLPPNGNGYQRLGLFNGTEFTIRYPDVDVTEIKKYSFKEEA